MLCVVKIKFDGDISGCNSMMNLCKKLTSIDMHCVFEHNDLSKGVCAISNALPYVDNDYFVPKPAAITEKLKEIDITSQKALRTINYIELSKLSQYFAGEFDYLQASKLTFGSFYRKDKSYFRMDSNTGIYFILLDANEKMIAAFEAFVAQYIMLQFGVNVCTQVIYSLPKLLAISLSNNTKKRLTLSLLRTDVPDKILNDLCNDAAYTIIEKQDLTDKNKICYINAGAVMNGKSLDAYNRDNVACISLGCLED